MKRRLFAVGLFVLAFLITYVCLCYCVPAWRIKLEANAFVYFIESIKSLFLIKAIVSLLVGVAVGIAPVLIGKFRKK